MSQIQVKVYFAKPSGQIPPPNNSLELTPVTRHANAAAPARGALEALLANATMQEVAAGFIPLDSSNLSIGALTIENHHADVDFYSGGTKSWAGDLSPVIFKHAVALTLKQFSTVHSVIVKVDGNANFDSLEG